MEIQPKAFDTRTNKMVKLYSLAWPPSGLEVNDQDGVWFKLLWPTGLRDKDGEKRRQIFEDDILEAVAVEIKKDWPGYHDMEMSRRRVRWLVVRIPGGFQLKNGNIDEYYAVDTPLLSKYYEHSNNIFCSHGSFGRRDYIKYEGIKIIGSIHTHPHLLQEGK